MNKNLPFLNSDRLVLRPIELKDADDMFLYAIRENVGPNAGWPPHKKKEETIAIIESMIENFLTDTNIGVFSILYQDKMIGTVGVHKYDKKHNCCEIGYVLNPDYWGVGIMPEAVKLVIQWLFDDFGIYRIECGHYDFNNKSKRVIEKLGFTFEGISRKKINRLNGDRCDLYHYSILKDEYINKTLPWQKD